MTSAGVRVALLCISVVRIVLSSARKTFFCRAKHHDHIPQLTLKERELERRKQEQERAKWGLTGEHGHVFEESIWLAYRMKLKGILTIHYRLLCFIGPGI